MTTAIPENPNAWLRRKTTAEALVEAGFPVSEKTLATKAVRGGGPPYQTFGRIALYRWANTLAWAEGELAAPRSRSAATEARRELEPQVATAHPRPPDATRRHRHHGAERVAIRPLAAGPRGLITQIGASAIWRPPPCSTSTPSTSCAFSAALNTCIGSVHAQADLLAELADQIGGMPATLTLLAQYEQRQTPAMLRLTGGEHFPPRQLRMVPR